MSFQHTTHKHRSGMNDVWFSRNEISTSSILVLIQRLHVNIPSKAVYAWTADATENCQSGDELDAHGNLPRLFFFSSPKDSWGLKLNKQTKDLLFIYYTFTGPQTAKIRAFGYKELDQPSWTNSALFYFYCSWFSMSKYELLFPTKLKISYSICKYIWHFQDFWLAKKWKNFLKYQSVH